MKAAGRISTRWKTALLLGAGVLLYVLIAGAVDPTTAEAQIPILSDAADAVGGLLGGAADAVTGLGAEVLKEALEWLLGGLKAAITLELVKFLTTIELPVAGSLSDATGPIVVIGGFFLVVGLITSIGDGYREIVAGTDTAPRVIGQAIFRVIGLALLLGSWFWIVPLAVEVANGMSHYVLSDGAVASALRRTYSSERLLSIGFPLLGLLTGIFMALAILILVVLKFVIAIAFACLYVGGPALIGFAALPRVGTLPLAIATRGVVTLTLIPLAWTVVFVAWAGVSAGTFDAATGAGSGVVSALMGPGLFLAGLVVMLAVTKKVLSMASFGLPLEVGGTGIVRSTLRSFINVAAAKALVDAASAGGKAAEAGAGAAARAPIKGGVGRPIHRGVPTSQSGAQGATGSDRSTGSPRRKRKLFEGGDAATNSRKEWGQRHEHRARVEEAEREEQARDANAIATGMRRGVWRSREAPRTDYESLAQRVDELRTVWGAAPTGGAQAAGEGDAARAGMAQAPERAVWAGVPADRVKEAGRALPAGDRSGLAGAARAAVENHPGDPVAAWREFRHAGTNQYAGREISGEEREAVASVLAAPPERVWEAFRPDYERFQWRKPDTGEPSTGGYDPDLFRFGHVTGGR
jgi:hypothetical protein